MLTTVMILSTMMAISSSSWVVVWMFMEMNTMSMCMMMEKSKKSKMEKNQTTVNYYMVQCLASIMLLSIMMTSQIPQETKMTMGVMMLMMKMGMWPFHMWYMKVLSELKMSEKPFMMMVTWQKVMPTVMVMSLMNLKSYEMMAIMMVNMMTMVTMLKKKTSMKSMVVLSSGFNNSMIICSSMSVSLMVMFISVYSISMVMVLMMVEKKKKKSMNPSKQILKEAMITANLGGLPPFMMFFGKVMVMKNLIMMNIMELSFVMILMMCGFMYHYYWTMSVMMMESTSKTQMFMKSNMKGAVMVLMTLSTMSAMMIVLLGLTMKDLSW